MIVLTPSTPWPAAIFLDLDNVIVNHPNDYAANSPIPIATMT